MVQTFDPAKTEKLIAKNLRIAVQKSDYWNDHKKLAEDTDTTETNLSRYLSGARLPHINILLDFCAVLGISLHDLLFLDFEKVKVNVTTNKDEYSGGQTFNREKIDKNIVKNLKKLVNNSKYCCDHDRLAADLGMEKYNLSRYLSGDRTPHPSVIKDFCVKFKITADELALKD